MSQTVASPVSAEVQLKKIALVGNPNTGKSTLFNCLTGLRQRVGNYPGVTVQKKVGLTALGVRSVEIIDLPGTYSLSADSPDERVVVDVLRGEFATVSKPDLTLCIVDATNLDRNLFLAYQIGQLGLPMVLAVNHWDSARKRHIEIDIAALQERLGIPVVPISAARAQGMTELKTALAEALDARPMLRGPQWPPAVTNALGAVRDAVGEQGAELDDPSILRAIFDEDQEVFLRVGIGKPTITAALEAARKALFKGGMNPTNAEAVFLYRHIKDTINPCISITDARVMRGSESIDGLLTHKFWGLVTFLGLMYLVFQSVYSWANPFMDLIEGAKSFVQQVVSQGLERFPMIQSLATDGVIEGVGAVVTFLPQILTLFFFIALLEDTGYMARAAYLMDKLFSWCGLSGKSFVPLLSSYACAIPGVMATRTIQDPKARLVTILAAPFMSCSARLPVYVLLIGAFIEPRYGASVAGLALFGMHFVGLAVALPLAYLMNRYVLKTPPQPFLLELPSYQIPKVRDVFLRMYSQGRAFVVNAGTVIFAFTIVIWALLYFPRPDSVGEATEQAFVEETAAELAVSKEAAAAAIATNRELLEEQEHRVASAYIEQSFMGRIGKTLQPAFSAAGFDWKITVGVVASFPAREVIISTIGIIYSLGGDVDEEAPDLRETMAQQTWTSGPRIGEPVYTIPVVFAIMVFFALCQQCGATLAVIAQETNWGWSLASFLFMTTTAWIAATLVYQFGQLFA